jgi:hypothetical protein
MTMNDTWGFKSYDHNWKSHRNPHPRNLVDIASKGGNYLLNVGPTAEGEIPPPSIERLKEVGAWMKVNGESIYGTTPARSTSSPHVGCSPRAMTTLPVRTVSMMLNCENMVTAASTFGLSPVIMTIIEVGVRSTVLPPKCSAIWSAIERSDGEHWILMSTISLVTELMIRGVLEAMDHIDELGDLHDDLVEALRVAGNADGHAREVGVAAFGDDQ